MVPATGGALKTGAVTAQANFYNNPTPGVRAARIAVYTLLGLDKHATPVTAYWKHPDVLAKAIFTAYRS